MNPWTRSQALHRAAVILGLWTAATGYLVAHDKPLASWYFFERAVPELFTTSGLRFYEVNPDLQFGPLTTLAAAPFVALGHLPGGVVAAIVMGLVGIAVLALGTAAVEGGRLVPRPRAFLGLGLLVLPVWTELAFAAGHLDDVLALALAVGGLSALRVGRHGWAAVLLGLAVDAKPWLVAMAVCVLLVPRSERLRAAILYAVTVAVAWVPFFVADFRTPNAMSFAVRVDTDAVLALLGLGGAAMPLWVRPLQLVLALAVALPLVRARRAAAILLATIAVRIATDPRSHQYFSSGAVLAAAIADAGLGLRRPWFTGWTVLLLWAPSLGPALPDTTLAVLRLLWAVGALAGLAVVVVRQRRRAVGGVDTTAESAVPVPAGASASAASAANTVLAA